MKCSKIHRILTEDLSAAALSEIRDHLRNCRCCRELLKDLQALDELNRSLPRRAQAPADFGNRVISGLEDPGRRRHAAVYLMVLPALLLGAAIGWHLSSSPSAGGSPETAAAFDAAETETPLDRLQTGEVRSGNLNSGYVEVIVEDEDGTPFLIRIPSMIEIQETDVQSEPLALVSY